MGELEDFTWFTIKRDLTKTNLNIYQPDLINKMTQVFNKNVKSLMTFNILATPIRVLYVINKQTQKYQIIYIRVTGGA